MIPILRGNCERCPLNGRPCVQGSGEKNWPMIIGEAPGQNEVTAGKPFVGQSGQLLRKTLALAGMDPNRVRYTNAVLCHPTKNATPDNAALRACNDRLFQEIELCNPSKILLVGAISLQASRHSSSSAAISRERGRGYWLELSAGDLFSGTSAKSIYTVATYHPSAILREPGLFRDFAHDIEKWAKNSAPYTPPAVDVWIPDTSQEAVEMLQQICEAPVLSCDLETTGLDPRLDGVVSVGFGALTEGEELGGIALIIPGQVMTPLVIKAILDVVKGVTYEGVLVYHNAKFDLSFLLHENIQDAGKNVIDTLLLHYLLDERTSESAHGTGSLHGLKSLSQLYFDVEDYSWNFDAFFKQPEHQRDYTGLFKYQARDCIYTRILYDRLTEEIWKESPKLFGAYENLLRPGLLTLGSIEYRGVTVDVPYLQELDGQMGQAAHEYVLDLCRLAGDEVDPNSPAQLSKILYQDWGLVKPNLKHTSETATGEAELQHLLKSAELDKGAREFLETLLSYRENLKLHRTYVRGLLKAADENGRVHPSYLLHGTTTGRLSCRDPNLQNIPKHGSGALIRRAFIPAEGHVWVEADYSTLEYRVAAWYSQDPAMIKFFKAGKDIHLETAKLIFGREEITAKERDLAKRIGFGILYGMGAESLAAQVGSWGGKKFTAKDADVFVRQYLAAYPNLKDWIEETERKCRTDHYVETPFGRRRRFPLILPGDTSVLRQAVNTPIQSLASDICLSSLIKLEGELTEGRILVTVHDSISFEIEAVQLEAAMERIRRTMVDVPLEDRGVPFEVTIKTGENWAAV